MFPTKLKGKKTPAGKYVEGLFGIWMFVKSKMHEQPRLNQFLICMLRKEMYNPGMVLHLFQIFYKNKLFCVCRYAYYCSGYLGLGRKKICFEAVLSDAKREWQEFVPCSAAWPRQQRRALHNCCIAAGGTALRPRAALQGLLRAPAHLTQRAASDGKPSSEQRNHLRK